MANSWQIRVAPQAIYFFYHELRAPGDEGDAFITQWRKNFANLLF